MRSRFALLLLVLAGCPKDPVAVPNAAARPVAADAAMLPVSADAAAVAAEETIPAPGWWDQAPRLETTPGGRRAVAVGRARSKDVSMARALAESRARVALARLLAPGAPNVDQLQQGVRVSAEERLPDGTLVVQVEVELPR